MTDNDDLESSTNLASEPIQIQDIRIGGTRDGKILAYDMQVIQEAGAYARFGAFLPFMTGRMLTGTYHIPNAYMSSR